MIESDSEVTEKREPAAERKPRQRDNNAGSTRAAGQEPTNGVQSQDRGHGQDRGQDHGRHYGAGQGGGGYQGGYDRQERPKAAAMEVVVENNIEKAMKVLKRKLIKEGLFKELKSRRYYEKPSEKRKRKHKESLKKIRKEEMRQKKGAFLFS